MAESGDLGKVLGPLEGEVVRALWAADGGLTVPEVQETLNAGRAKPLAYTTVMTVMSRLAEKGVLHRRREGRGYRYEAVADDAAGIAVSGVVRTFGDSAMAQFVDQARADPALLARLRALLDEDDG
jgi:predicted transcriptional regulator